MFTAYLDDSGNPDGLSGQFLTVAGYSATVAGWTFFEQQWADVLGRYGVPYLHMKEFGDSAGIYREIKRNERIERQFLEEIISVIQRSCEFATAATVFLPDLDAFNADHGIGLDAYSICTYGCLLEFSQEYQGNWVGSDVKLHAIFDKFDKAMSRVDLAFQYAKTDHGGHMGIDKMSSMVIPECDSFRNILPLQAADFLAWETRKRCQDQVGWAPTADDLRTLAAIDASHAAWRQRHEAEHGAPPRKQRGSYRNLRLWPHPMGKVWRRPHLEDANGRHPLGWLEN